MKLAIATSGALVATQLIHSQQWLRRLGALYQQPLDEMSEYKEGRSVLETRTSPAARPIVAIVRGDDPAAMLRNAVALAGGLGPVVSPGSTVLIKPNLTIPSASGKGNVTDSRVLQATIELCRQAGASRVVVADGSGGGDTADIMRQAGYEPVLKATGATFLDLNQDEVVVGRLNDPSALAEYSLAKTAMESQVLISLPVLKVHSEAIVSLSCKNLMGIAARSVYGRPRQQLHNAGIQRVIADLARLRLPDFAIVDGIVGLEGNSPMNGTAVTMNLIIAGRNPVSVDAVAAAVMGFDPQQLEQLNILTQKGAGPSRLSEITVKGNTVAEVQRKFRR